jgi:hypothetical protein
MSEPAPAFEPIPAFERNSASEEVPIEALNTTNEIESMASCEIHWCSLPEDKQNFWQIFVPSGLFIIPISLVMLQLL